MLLSLAEPMPQMLSALESTWKSAWGKKRDWIGANLPHMADFIWFFSHFFTSFCDQLRINHDKRGRKKRQEALETAAEALRIFVEINDRKFEAGLFFQRKSHKCWGNFDADKMPRDTWILTALLPWEVLTLIVTGMAHYKFFMYDAMLEDVDASSQFFFRQSKTWNEVNWACLYDFFSDALEIHWNPTFRDCWIHNRF